MTALSPSPEIARILSPGRIAAPALGFLILFAIAAASAWLAQANRHAFDQVDKTQQIEQDVATVFELLQNAETGQRGYLLTEKSSYLEPYLEALDKLPPKLNDLTLAVAHDPLLAGDLDRMRDPIAEKLAELARTIELNDGGNRAAALAEVETDRGKSYMDQIRSSIDAMALHSGELLTERLRSARRIGDVLAAVQISGIVLVLALAFAVANGFRRSTQALRLSQGELETANANLEEIVSERTRNLAEANDEIQRFAYIVSHDLRAPLVNVMGFTSELEHAVDQLGAFARDIAARYPDEHRPEIERAIAEDLPEALRFIRSSSEKMDRLIGAILKISREGRRSFTAEPVDVTRLVEGVRDTLRQQAAELRTEITIEPLPRLMSDKLAVEQIFSNLLENAVKYSKPQQNGHVRVSGREAGSTAVFEVEDDGRGVAPQDHERIFELFRRAGDQSIAGEGIGLAHVRALARRLGGDVACVSSLGAGAVFRLTLPLRPPIQRETAR